MFAETGETVGKERFGDGQDWLGIKTSGPKSGLISKILLGGLAALAVIGVIAFIINLTKPET